MKKIIFTLSLLTLVGADKNCPNEELCGNSSIDIQEECDDGNTLNGDGCSSECYIENALCSMDVFQCPDGTLVSRTGNDCSFDCSDDDDENEVEIPKVCPSDAHMCPDGTWIGRSGEDCVFDCSQHMVNACNEDMFECPDGIFVYGVGPNCEHDCADHSEDAYNRFTPEHCEKDRFMCGDGTEVGRSGDECIFDCRGHELEDTIVEDCTLGESTIEAGGIASESTFGEITTYKICTSEGVQPDFAYTSDIDDTTVPDMLIICTHYQPGRVFNQNYEIVTYSDWGCNRYCTCDSNGDLMCTPYIMCIN